MREKGQARTTRTRTWARGLMGIGLLVGLAHVVVPDAPPFEELVALCEGQGFDGKAGEYLVDADGQSPSGSLPEIGFTHIEATRVHNDAGAITELSARIRVHRGGAAEEVVIGPNTPGVLGDVRVELEQVGLAPLFAIRAPGFAQPVTTCVNLNVWAANAPPDDFIFPGLNTRFIVRFFPDYVPTPDGPVSRSMHMNNPAVEVRVVGLEDDSVHALATVQEGQGFRWGNTRVTLQGLRRWAMFKVSTEPRGPALLYVGAALLLLGMLLGLWSRLSGRSAPQASAGAEELMSAEPGEREQRDG